MDPRVNQLNHQYQATLIHYFLLEIEVVEVAKTQAKQVIKSKKERMNNNIKNIPENPILEYYLKIQRVLGTTFHLNQKITLKINNFEVNPRNKYR